jgi:acyl carrier protein
MLVSRSGLQTNAAHELVAELQQRGVDVRVSQCDVADLIQLQAIFAEVQEQMPTLAGIFHLAMVLDDGAVMNMNRSRFQHVARPKFRGACNLHRLSQDLSLDYFVLFSSASASAGFPGQANYAAANAGLEGLAAFRRAHGLPASAIGWGLIGDVGYAASRPEIVNHLRHIGYYEIRATEFRKAFELALGANEPLQAVARADWHVEVQKLRSRGNRQALLSAMVDVEDSETTLTPDRARDAILDAAPEERLQLVSDLMRELAGRVLGMGASRIETDKPLAELGFDSLMALELAGQVESQLGVAFPLRSLGDDVTLGRISELLARAITG